MIWQVLAVKRSTLRATHISSPPRLRSLLMTDSVRHSITSFSLLVCLHLQFIHAATEVLVRETAPFAVQEAV